MLMRLLFSLTLLTILAATGCKPDPIAPEDQATLTMEFAPEVGGLRFFPEQTYRNHNGQRMLLERYRFLVSDLRLVRDDGTEDTLTRSALVDFVEPSFRTVEELVPGECVGTFRIDPGRYEELRFGLGVGPDRNNGNPADYDEAHPLSIRRGMHWTWSSGYIFLQIDGRVDTTGTDTAALSQGFIYHPGLNELYREMVFPLDNFQAEEQGALDLTLEVDLARAFYNNTEGIDMKVDNLTHATPPGSDAFRLAEQVVDNFVSGAFTLD